MKTYRCGGCGATKAAVETRQGGKHHESIPDGWAEFGLRENGGADTHAVLCPPCTQALRSALWERAQPVLNTDHPAHEQVAQPAQATTALGD